MSNHRLSLSTHVSSILYVYTRLPRIKWICYNLTLKFGLSDGIGLYKNPYYILIRYFINSWRINYHPWSYIISVDQICLVKHVVSTKLIIVISCSSLYSMIYYQPVKGSIIVTALRFKYYFFPFLHIT